jgi:hypothetical protein
VKEIYEPLFEGLLQDSRTNGFKIRGIWIADVAMQGQSGVINEKTMGNDRQSDSHHLMFQHLNISSIMVRPSPRFTPHDKHLPY